MTWRTAAKCRDGDPDLPFVTGEEASRLAPRLCRDCRVRTDCLVEALDNRIEWGIWGGLTETQRRSLLKRYPTRRSWRWMVEAQLVGQEWTPPVRAAGGVLEQQEGT